jgi:hypothetical protein
MDADPFYGIEGRGWFLSLKQAGRLPGWGNVRRGTK